MASITATSVLGRKLYQSSSISDFTSERRGDRLTNFAPAAAASITPSRWICAPVPPLLIWLLNAGNPPKASINSVFLQTDCQLVWCANNSIKLSPKTCGMMTSPAARLYVFLDEVYPPVEFRKRWI